MDTTPDWALVKSFLAVAETGSLSAAGRTSGISQPTIGRHIRELEAQLSVTLFTRQARGLQLTDAGQDLLPAARDMRDAAMRLHLTAAGREADLRGTVRITASHVVSHTLLPQMIAELRRVEPLIQIELVPTDSSENLLFREADIALRMYRPTQLDVITRHVATLPVGLYAASTYLDRAGRPRTMHDLLDMDFIGFDRSELILTTLRTLGFDLTREHFPVRCDDQIVYWQLLRAGCGFGAVQVLLGDPEPLVERILPELTLPSWPVWLTAPQALRQSPRIRRVYDFLADALTRLKVPADA